MLIWIYSKLTIKKLVYSKLTIKKLGRRQLEAERVFIFVKKCEKNEKGLENLIHIK